MARQIITTANAPSSPLPFESTGRERDDGIPEAQFAPVSTTGQLQLIALRKLRRVCSTNKRLGRVRLIRL